MEPLPDASLVSLQHLNSQEKQASPKVATAQSSESLRPQRRKLQGQVNKGQEPPQTHGGSQADTWLFRNRQGPGASRQEWAWVWVAR